MRPFQEYLTREIRSAGIPPRTLTAGECLSSTGERCPLCWAGKLAYRDELPLKQLALRRFWEDLPPVGPLDPLVASPEGRHYRTVTKRRVFRSGRDWYFGLIDTAPEGLHRGINVPHCAIEPDAHATIYAAAQKGMNKPYALPLAERLRYLIIKGSCSEFIVILSVGELSPGLLKAANTLSKSLSRASANIIGLYLYEDTTDGRYYLGEPNAPVKQMKKLFGKERIFQRIGGKPFLYPASAFSQVNGSLVQTILAASGEALDLQPQQTLYDLYCGYGLFSLSLAAKVKRVVGVEISRQSVRSAVDNARRQKVTNARFVCSDITRDHLGSLFRNASPGNAVLLDPPRGGTSHGVIETIAAQRPERVVHLFCNIDLMSSEIARWMAGGYRITRAVPFDMFPGTAALEVMVLLEKL